jgi:hypothetical protein
MSVAQEAAEQTKSPPKHPAFLLRRVLPDIHPVLLSSNLEVKAYDLVFHIGTPAQGLLIHDYNVHFGHVEQDQRCSLSFLAVNLPGWLEWLLVVWLKACKKNELIEYASYPPNIRFVAAIALPAFSYRPAKKQ